ncbi:MAG: riboflavin biosynthesis protein RibD [Verrucomicrobia bacterium RIFCSPHIGHO2_12_FULL_41_10]|nr:MAG: riboflavin biosynthesis protein RibD [Verrucomicrobia bacterium RIFCSPHIGHO2_12_FULL_41_10]
MHLALREAKKGYGRTSPNPIVGAIIVYDGKVIARGYHHAAGQPHAEIEAIKKLPSPEAARGATLYVTLEPCSTTGKTPPCTEALIAANFARVVYGATDPNPHHQGHATILLRKAGIEVSSGVLAEECTALNCFWNYRMITGRPWIIAKCGMSLDGKISSPPHQRWITSPESRHHAMLLRTEVDAILVGGATVRIDNPALTIRGVHRFLQPWRIIWTTSGTIPKEAQVLNDAHQKRTIVITKKSLRATIEELGKQGISSILIEGGGRTLGAAFDEDLVDEVRFYMAPLLIEGPTPAIGGEGGSLQKMLTRLRNISYKTIGSDVVISGIVKKE